jgi:3-dehydroquinate synthase
MKDVWGPFGPCAARMPEGSLVVVDRRVAELHPGAMAALKRRRPRAWVSLQAGERVKSLDTVARLLSAGASLPRSGTLVCVGGGTLGDVCTVTAHLLKRGVALIHVPTTLLAAVDSSVGGKGAVHVTSGSWVLKNGAGVFHDARETWLCPELFETLTSRQRREGATEAWKMVACLDAPRWRKYRRHRPGLVALVRDARALKAIVCRRDPHEQTGFRRVLNFGHTLGHVVESLTRFRVSHGDAVGLGMVCALDLGRRMGVTPEAVASEVEQGLTEGPGILGREELGRALRGHVVSEASALLAQDKKVGPSGGLNFVLLHRLGHAGVHPVPPRALRALWLKWQRAERP